MRKREFIGILTGAVLLLSWSVTAHAQKADIPTVGLFRSSPAAPFAHLVEALRQGLGDEGFEVGRNVSLEQRWADNQVARLPELADDLVRRRVDVIVGNQLAVKAAMALTTSIPIVFVIGNDPVEGGFVKNLSRPGGNLTGVTFFGGSKLDAKRMELLRELKPNAQVIAALIDPNYAGSLKQLLDLVAAERALGRQVVVVKASNQSELEPAFAEIVQSGAQAIMVSGGAFFTSRRRILVTLAARHAIPAIYDVREFVEAGGLISYSASITNAYRQAGGYVGRIRKGAKPSELPVLIPTTFELAINLKTAKALSITVPATLLARADEVIE